MQSPAEHRQAGRFCSLDALGATGSSAKNSARRRPRWSSDDGGDQRRGRRGSRAPVLQRDPVRTVSWSFHFSLIGTPGTTCQSAGRDPSDAPPSPRSSSSARISSFGPSPEGLQLRHIARTKRNAPKRPEALCFEVVRNRGLDDAASGTDALVVLVTRVFLPGDDGAKVERSRLVKGLGRTFSSPR